MLLLLLLLLCVICSCVSCKHREALLQPVGLAGGECKLRVQKRRVPATQQQRQTKQQHRAQPERADLWCMEAKRRRMSQA
jgi:hypothetical protein